MSCNEYKDPAQLYRHLAHKIEVGLARILLGLRTVQSDQKVMGDGPEERRYMGAAKGAHVSCHRGRTTRSELGDGCFLRQRGRVATP